MTRTLNTDTTPILPRSPHSRLHCARLVRLLRELACADGNAAAGDFAEQVSRWLGVADAIALHAVLHRPAPSSAGEAASQNGIAAQIASERDALRQMITAACSAQGIGRIRFPAAALLRVGADGVSHQPLHSFHRAVQRELEQRIGRLRARTRTLLAQANAQLQPLADLDEAMDRALTSRASELFAEIPALLERRFMHLYDDHRQSLADDAATWAQPGGWLARFRDDLHDVLQAELELRLQPVLGLAAASHQEPASLHE